MMDDESGEPTGEYEVAGVGRDESKLERLVRGCCREAGSTLCQHQAICLRNATGLSDESR